MPRLRTQAAKDNLLRRVRKQRLKYITILPSLITILNGVCGFGAIVLAGKGATARIGQFPCLAVAGYMILLAMIADMLDGRLARMSQSTSSFGGQLDSLCDIISFGVAPALLMLKNPRTQISRLRRSESRHCKFPAAIHLADGSGLYKLCSHSTGQVQRGERGGRVCPYEFYWTADPRGCGGNSQLNNILPGSAAGTFKQKHIHLPYLRKRYYVCPAVPHSRPGGADGQQNSISPYLESVHKGQKTFRTFYQGPAVSWADYLEQTGGSGIDFLRLRSKWLR